MKCFLALSEKTNYVIILLFIIFSLPLLLNHEPWRDEAQAWLIARDSQNLTSIIHLMGYEGTPALWHFILFPLAKLELPYFSMAAVHFLLILSAIIVFINYAPFSKFQKLLFSFGYYIFYEYSIIARNYALSVLFLFLIASIYKERLKKPVLYSLLLILLANTNVYSLVIAIVLSVVYVSDLKSQKTVGITKMYIIPFLIIISGFLISIYQLLPPADLNPYTARWNLDLSTTHISTIPDDIVGAFLPIPRPGISFWNTKLLSYPIAGVFVFLLSLGFFIKKPEPMFIYLLSSAGLFGIFFLKYVGGLRHDGLIFIIFVFSLWIANEYEEKSLIKNKLINKIFNQKNLTYLFVTLLFFQVAASPIAAYYELYYDFSAGKKTATFLKDNGFINNNTFIATYPSPMATAILPYIPIPYSQFYYVEYKDYRSFMVWNKEYSLNGDLSIDEIVDRVDNAIRDKNYNTVLIIINKKADGEKIFSQRYDLIAYFDRTIVDDESYYLYQLKLQT